MTCPDCATAAQVEHHGFADGCMSCRARGLARIFLRKGERGRKLRMACEQAEVTQRQVHDAWAADAMNKDRPA